MINYREIHGWFAEVFYVENDDDRYAATVYRTPQYPDPEAAQDHLRENVCLILGAIFDEDKDDVAAWYAEGDEDVCRKVDMLKSWIESGFIEENPLDPSYDGRIRPSITYESKHE